MLGLTAPTLSDTALTGVAADLTAVATWIVAGIAFLIVAVLLARGARKIFSA